MSVPRFRPHKLLKGRQANMMLDSIDDALNLTSNLDETHTTSSGGVTSLVGYGGVDVSPNTGDVVVSITGSGGYDPTKVYLARAYNAHSFQASTATPTAIRLEGLGAGRWDPFGEFGIHGAWTAAASGYYCVTAKVEVGVDFLGAGGGIVYKNGLAWRSGIIQNSPFSGSSSSVFGFGFIAMGDTLTLYGYSTVPTASPSGDWAVGTATTFMEICRIG